jgi:magnesium-transporting ATPase (P-type)
VAGLCGTKAVWIAIGVVVAGQFAISYLSPLQHIFQTQAMALHDSLIILAIGIVLFIAIELEKQLRMRL